MSAPNRKAGTVHARDLRRAILHRLADSPATEVELTNALHFATAGQVRAAIRHLVAKEHVMSRGVGRNARRWEGPVLTYYLPADLVAEAAALGAGSGSGRRAVPRHGGLGGSGSRVA